MGWTLYNSSSASIAVNDIPIPQTILPYTSATFQAQDVISSLTLNSNLANGALCVTNFGSFDVGGPWLPVTYPAHASAQETQNGNSLTFTMGVFQQGKLLLNVTAISVGGSIAIGWEDFDGTTYYPNQTEITAVTVIGQTPATFTQYGIAGRLTWTIVGTVTFSLALQMR